MSVLLHLATVFLLGRRFITLYHRSLAAPWIPSEVVHVHSVAELVRNVLSSCLFKQIPGFVGDLLIHGARRGWVDFALAEFLLGGVEPLIKVILLWLTGCLSLVVHIGNECICG